jgi:DNA polymerase I-like protein with 3'-5' exonuclease and polymerase domains
MVSTARGAAQIERLIDDLRKKKSAALGMVLACTTDRPGHDPDPRHFTLSKLFVAAPDDDQAHVHVIEADDEDTWKTIAPLLQSSGDERPPYVVFHHAQAALTVLTRLGLAPTRIGCVTTAATVLAQGADRHRDQRNLSDCVADRLGHAINDPPRAGEIQDDETLAIAADVLVPLMRSYTPTLREQGTNTVYELETHLLPAVVDMEQAGMRLDVPAFETMASEWATERETATDDKRIGRLDKLLSTYRWWSRDYVDHDGRIRCRLHPLTTESGRFSCSDPNLQQVPSEHTAPGFRRCFVPADGNLFIIADYAQIELRVAAHMAPCDALRAVFREGRDAHRATAATITGKPESEISSRERQMAKAVNFGFLFGMGSKRFRSYAKDSYGIELDDDEAAAARAAFFRTFPGIAAWHRRIRTLSRKAEIEDITVRTAMGRRKKFLAGKFSYNAALNIPVQGTAAEGFKLAMTKLHASLGQVAGQGVLCVHDEYIAEVSHAYAEEACAIVETIMRDEMASLVTSVPIEVEAKIVDSWAEK